MLSFEEFEISEFEISRVDQTVNSILNKPPISRAKKGFTVHTMYVYIQDTNLIDVLA